jgi:SAM-dependent methyltransferase
MTATEPTTVNGAQQAAGGANVVSTGTAKAGAPGTIDEGALVALVEQAVGDLGSLLNGALVVVGDRLGLYRALRDGGAQTPGELAARTGTVERNVREWLCAQAAAGYVTYDGDGRYRLSPEQAEVLTNETSPAFVTGGFQVCLAATKADEKITDAFRHGRGLGWEHHHHDLFHGTERFFRPGYAANLVSTWLPALDGVVARLQAGGTVADVGCGHGASSILMAQAFPASRVVGFDAHGPSIEAARQAAERAGVTDRARFEVATATSFSGPSSGAGYDLVCFFDCLHDMGDPVGALAHTRRALAPEGTVLLVEPRAGDDVAENLNPVGRVFYAASTLICTPASQAQEVGLALGAQAGEARLRQVATFNLVLELRP